MDVKKRVALGVAGTVLAVGAGLGISSLAQADPTPKPTPSAGASKGSGGRGVGHAYGRLGVDVSALASKLGVTEDALKTAFKNIQDATKAAGKPDQATEAEREAALAKALAAELKLDETKVTQALAELRAERQGEIRQAFQDRLAKAVTDGTLTQSEADAVQKAADAGVIGMGGRR